MLVTYQIIVAVWIVTVVVVQFYYTTTFFKKPHKPGKPMKTLGIACAIALLVGIYATFTNTKPDIFSAIGVIISAGGLSLFIWARDTVGKHTLNLAFSETQHTTLIENGPFNYIRHPFYTSYSIIWISFIFLASNPLLGLIPILIVLPFYVYAALQEETSFLSSPLSQAYKRYSSRTGRFLPAIFRSRGTIPRI